MRGRTIRRGMVLTYDFHRIRLTLRTFQSMLVSVPFILTSVTKDELSLTSSRHTLGGGKW